MAVVWDPEIYKEFGSFQVLFPENGGPEYYSPLEVAEFLNQTSAWLLTTARKMQDKLCALPDINTPEEFKVDVYDKSIPFTKALEIFVRYYKLHYLDVQVFHDEYVSSIAEKRMSEENDEVRRVVEELQINNTCLREELEGEKMKNSYLNKELELNRNQLEIEQQKLATLEHNVLNNLPTNIVTVIEMLQAGNTDSEIAIALHKGKNNSGMSQAQVKALLWRGSAFPSEQSVKNSMKEFSEAVKKKYA